MEINKILSAGFVAAAVLLNAGSAIDADIQAKTGLGLKQYCQHFKTLAAAAALPHHGALGGTDTDELAQDHGQANCNVYIPAEVVRAKARALAAIDALGTCGGGAGGIENLLAAVVAGPNQPANPTVGGFRAAFDAAFDAAVGVHGANILAVGPLANNHKAHGVAIEAVDTALQFALAPWLTALHAVGLGQANVLDAGRQAAILVEFAGGGAPVADTLQALHDYIQAAAIDHP
ncbi:MAG: hypothetical protein NTW22_05705 [Proteobacteria bacterium]|nr:hypothetical protein [Pseudomonadota bacterium]